MFVQTTEISRMKPQKKVKSFITYIKIYVKRKWICPRESWGPEDFKTGIAFKNWPIMKPIPSKTRKVEKSEYQFSISAKGKRIPYILPLNPS